MKLEDQVCSLELAKRLKELGVEQDSLWYWVHGDHGEFDLWHDVYRTARMEEETFSAFTVAELGMMLPGSFNSRKFVYANDAISWSGNVKRLDRAAYSAEHEATLRAMLLVYLIEHGYIQIRGE